MRSPPSLRSKLGAWPRQGRAVLLTTWPGGGHGQNFCGGNDDFWWWVVVVTFFLWATLKGAAHTIFRETMKSSDRMWFWTGNNFQGEGKPNAHNSWSMVQDRTSKQYQSLQRVSMLINLSYHQLMITNSVGCFWWLMILIMLFSKSNKTWNQQ